MVTTIFYVSAMAGAFFIQHKLAEVEAYRKLIVGAGSFGMIFAFLVWIFFICCSAVVFLGCNSGYWYGLNLSNFFIII